MWTREHTTLLRNILSLSSALKMEEIFLISCRSISVVRLKV
jgi:hypothetical protein